MSEQNEQVMSDEEKILLERAKAKRRSRGRRDGETEGGLNINSMMDMMVIIIVFLIKSVGSEPIQINQNDDLRLPNSTSTLAPEDMMVMSITKQWVMVEDESVIPINDGQIDPSALQSATSAVIPELQSRIEEQLNEQEQWARIAGREFEKMVTIISDSQTPYRVLTQVMITAAAAGVTNFKFAVIQRDQGSGVMATGG
jgi:biopolymer transport protein ExbD